MIKENFEMDNNHLYNNLIAAIGNTPYNKPSEELGEMIQCIGKAVDALAERRVEVILRSTAYSHEECPQMPVGQCRFTKEHILTGSKEDLIFEFLRIMYVTYDLSKKPEPWIIPTVCNGTQIEDSF